MLGIFCPFLRQIVKLCQSNERKDVHIIIIIIIVIIIIIIIIIIISIIIIINCIVQSDKGKFKRVCYIFISQNKIKKANQSQLPRSFINS